jgi:hypothetical protein
LDYSRRITDHGKIAVEMEICSRSIVYWINQWVWTFDPMKRFGLANIPFDLFPKQAEFLVWLAEREQTQTDGLIEKSRDMGVSWLCCLYALHGWLFREGFAAGFGSRKLEYVDEKGNHKSLFEKFRIALRNLPNWMLPVGFKWKVHDCFAKLINPENGSTITGEGGDAIGRGDRATIYFVDEAAFLERPQLVERSLSQTTNVRIDVSTPNGPGNPFCEKRFSGKVPVFTLHWGDDPRKDEEWYERQKERFDPVTVAQEIDIDYTASVEGICIPAAWVRAAVDLHLWAKKEHDIDFPQTEDPVAGLDVAAEGKNKSVFISRCGVVVNMPVAWSQCNTTETAWRARDLALERHVKVVNFDANSVGAGVKGTWDTVPWGLPFRGNGMMTGSTPTLTRWPDGKSSVEKFLNLRAEIWWNLRVRFEKAYEFREKGIRHPVEEMISILDCPQLIAELSMCLKEYTNTGKLKVESKDEMRARGVASPDYADALTMCFAPTGGEMVAEVLDVPSNRSWDMPADSAQRRRGYYGRK